MVWHKNREDTSLHHTHETKMAAETRRIARKNSLEHARARKQGEKRDGRSLFHLPLTCACKRERIGEMRRRRGRGKDGVGRIERGEDREGRKTRKRERERGSFTCNGREFCHAREKKEEGEIRGRGGREREERISLPLMHTCVRRRQKETRRG